MEGGSVEVALEMSEKAGDVKGVSMGRLIEGSVYMGERWRVVAKDSRREWE
jgi:hypothetical protein